MPGPPPALCSRRPARQTFSGMALPTPGRPGATLPDRSRRTRALGPPPARAPVCDGLSRPGLGQVSLGTQRAAAGQGKLRASPRCTRTTLAWRGGVARAGLGLSLRGISPLAPRRPFLPAPGPRGVSGAPRHRSLSDRPPQSPGAAPRSAGSRRTPGSTRGCSGVSFFISREDITSGEPAGTWMKLETIILSKLTQEQKTKHRMSSLISGKLNNENTWTQGGEHHTPGPVGDGGKVKESIRTNIECMWSLKPR
ncbi:uncharacterized protein isoform X3 [Macaca fascicularis]|uniref:uncharacterized protein isoform X3 n=1 Tax=Macaca fascicularis TaxID=9541 RepID=UPI003D15EDB8